MIAGNHDITLHKDLYLERLKNKHRNVPIDVDAVRVLWTGQEARDAGIVYLEEEMRTFYLKNGARLNVSVVRTTAHGMRSVDGMGLSIRVVAGFLFCVMGKYCQSFRD